MIISKLSKIENTSFCIRKLTSTIIIIAVILLISLPAVAIDVGIIPETSSGCPLGSEHIIINMDDEDHKNESKVSGWTGAISRYNSGTRFEFCRVNATGFQPPLSPYASYAVLKLSATCPANSIEFERVIHNEKVNNHNWSAGNISPNYFEDRPNPNSTINHYTHLYFCVFEIPSYGSPPVPNFYIPYGVFAAPSSAWLANGYVYSDDEDSLNSDYTLPINSSSTFTNIVYGSDNLTHGQNTFFLTAKVRNDSCNTSVELCPFGGSYDGANCWFGKPPEGTTAFVWSNNFYYTPVNGNQCPRPESSFDGANCYVMPVSSQANPFIWSNMWYVTPVCRP